MPSQWEHTSMGYRNAIEIAIAKELSGEEGGSELSPIESLIVEINASEEKKAWIGDIRSYLDCSRVDDRAWRLLEDVFAQTNLCDPYTADMLEHLVANSGVCSPHARASVYTILTLWGKPPTAYILQADKELKREEPLRWLDLMSKVLPSKTLRQNVIVELIRQSKFSVHDFSRRLNEMRELGQPILADWLYKLRNAFSMQAPEQDIVYFDKLVADAFHPDYVWTDVTTTSPEKNIFRRRNLFLVQNFSEYKDIVFGEINTREKLDSAAYLIKGREYKFKFDAFYSSPRILNTENPMSESKIPRALAITNTPSAARNSNEYRH